jgi:hypothetical protein
LTKEQHLRKSRSSKTAGWILLGGGVGMFVAGLATYELNFNILGESRFSNPNNTNAALLATGGAGAIVASIISFSAAKQHKKKAATFTFGNQRVPVLGQSGFVSQLQPTVKLRIPL